ncbi:MAG: hypothetical protein ACI4F7_09780 [Acutalibacteraceae bacterium]
MKRNLVKPFIRMLLPALAAILAIICALGTFGWFSMSHIITGKGANIQTKDIGVLEIRASAAGPDISASAVEEITERLSYDGDQKKLRPTASGSFSFYVNDSSAGAQTPYNFVYKLSVENDLLKDNANKGFYPNTDENEREQAKKYINSHLLFFSEYDEGAKLYKGWLQSGETIRCTATQNPQKVTVYWVWVDQYRQIFEQNSGLIDEETRKEIAAYYENHTEMMLSDGASPAEAYNVADTMIGMTLKYVCFLIEVTKV